MRQNKIKTFKKSSFIRKIFQNEINKLIQSQNNEFEKIIQNIMSLYTQIRRSTKL